MPSPHLLSDNQITWSWSLIQIHILNDKQCRSSSVGFFRSQLIWICTVRKGRAYPGSAEVGLVNKGTMEKKKKNSWAMFNEKTSLGIYRQRIIYKWGASNVNYMFSWRNKTPRGPWRPRNTHLSIEALKELDQEMIKANNHDDYINKYNNVACLMDHEI